MERIAQDDERIMRVFHSGYDRAAKWLRLYETTYGFVPRIASLSTYLSGSNAHQFFQHLYVGCWVAQPVEKGTYLIEYGLLPEPKRTWDAVNALTGRWSSHLAGGSLGFTGQGHSASEVNRRRQAGQGYGARLIGLGDATFQFIQGGNELLVQNIGESGGQYNTSSRYTGTGYLMLKMEGHLAYTKAHKEAYDAKEKTGGGKTFNPDLAKLARGQGTGGVDLGIEARAAENHDKGWQAVIRAVYGMKRKAKVRSTRLVREVVAHTCALLWSTGASERQAVNSAFPALAIGAPAKEIAEAVNRMSNPQVGQLLNTFVSIARAGLDHVFGEMHTGYSNKRIGLIFASILGNERDVLRLSRTLLRDDRDYARFGNEVHLQPRHIEEELLRFYNVLSAHQPISTTNV